MDNILYLETIIDEMGYKPRGFCITETGDVYTITISREHYEDLQVYNLDINECMYGLFRDKSENELSKISLDYIVEKFGNSDFGNLALMFLRERQIKSVIDDKEP
jgi:hypothetical protein